MPMRFFAFLLCICCVAFAEPNTTAAPKDTAIVQKHQRAAWITLEGEVDQGMADYTKRAIAKALVGNPDVIVFEINTFGGLLAAAFQIVDTITAIRDIPTVAFVSQKAISAGALIALSCNRLYMKPATTIGDCAPILQSESGPEILGEKIQSPLRAKFRNLAQRNGYPELLTQAMVTPGLEVMQLWHQDSIIYLTPDEFDGLSDEEKDFWKDHRKIVHDGELLTMTDVEAVDLGFSEATEETEADFKQDYGISEVNRIEVSWAENLARFLATISPLLMMLAFGALYMEFQTPGFGFFGMAAIGLFAIVFGGQYVSGLADKLPLVLLCIGVLFIFIEILFFPGTWIAGLASIGIIAAALVLLLRDVPSNLPIPAWKGVPLDTMTWALVLVLGSALAAMIIPVLASRYLLPRLPKSMSPMLSSELNDAQSPRESQADIVPIGTVGEALSHLKLAGRARFGEVNVEVNSRSEFLDKGVAVRVVAIENGRIVVVRNEVKNV